jgi:hypothetical protein
MPLLNMDESLYDEKDLKFLQSLREAKVTA